MGKKNFAEYHFDLQFRSKIRSFIPHFRFGDQMIEFNEETQRVGKEIQNYLAANGMSRDELARAIRRGKGTIDKLCSGRYSEKTLAAVTARTRFVRSNSYASDAMGKYSRISWENYIGNYVMIEPAFPEDGSVWIRNIEIKWLDDLPGLAMYEQYGEKIGNIVIPHERTPLIYIKADREGLYYAVSTMVGQKAMRGLKLSVQHVVANAYVPTVSPVSILYATPELQKRFPSSEAIQSDDPRSSFAIAEIDKIIREKYGIFVGFNWETNSLEKTHA